MPFGKRTIKVALHELTQWALGQRRLFRVHGASMEPTLQSGDFVWIALGEVPDVGDIVVAKEPEAGRHVVKRVRSHGKTTVALGSDNPAEGRDSRHFGSIASSDVLGVATVQFNPHRRRCKRLRRANAR